MARTKATQQRVRVEVRVVQLSVKGFKDVGDGFRGPYSVCFACRARSVSRSTEFVSRTTTGLTKKVRFDSKLEPFTMKVITNAKKATVTPIIGTFTVLEAREKGRGHARKVGNREHNKHRR